MTTSPARWAPLLALLILVPACTRADSTGALTGATSTTTSSTTTSTTTTTTTTSTTTTTTTTTTTIPMLAMEATVVDAAGNPVPRATISWEGGSATTGRRGRAEAEAVPPGTVTVERFGWLPTEAEFDGSPLAVTMEPRVVRAIRAIPDAAGDPDAYAALIDLAESTAVNALVFDTKDETGRVQYETGVEQAHRLDAVRPRYDPAEAIAIARENDLYTITRVVTFEDEIWARADPDAKLAGIWMDARDEDNWEYPLDLAVEACELGFDEVQFDYVRFPAGLTAQAAPDTTAEERVEAIRSFLVEGRRRVNRAGCAVSADIFAIVANSPGDEGIGQRPEEVSASVDAVSPMIYPSHYSEGWLGYTDPNDFPGPVTAHALDGALPRMTPGSVLRPWLQAFYYDDGEILAGIAEAESRGLGWILWNAAGNYSAGALPPPG